MKSMNYLLLISLLLIMPFALSMLPGLNDSKNTMSKGKGPAVKMISINNATGKPVVIDIMPVPGKDEMLAMSLVHLLLMPEEKRMNNVQIPFTSSKLYNIDATFAKTIHYHAENQAINSGDTLKITSDKNGYYIENYAGKKRNWTTKQTAK